MVELVLIGISTEVSMLSPHNAYPYEGHSIAALNIMSYLKRKHNSFLALELTYPEIFYENFETEKYWTKFYGLLRRKSLLTLPLPLVRV